MEFRASVRENRLSDPSRVTLANSNWLIDHAAIRSDVIEWLFAALNSVEMASLPWSLFKFSGDTIETPRKHLDQFLSARLQHKEAVLAAREWLPRPSPSPTY
jgi:hypothetical protein